MRLRSARKRAWERSVDVLAIIPSKLLTERRREATSAVGMMRRAEQRLRKVEARHARIAGRSTISPDQK